MRFWNKSKGFRLVVEPRLKVIDPSGGTPGRTSGLSVEFHQVGQYGVWDSEQAQRQKHWTDEQRKAAERALLEHETFGVTMHLLDLPDEEAKVLGQARLCMFVRPQPSGEIAFCGREITGDAPYCERCTALLGRAEELAKQDVVLVDEPVGESETVTVDESHVVEEPALVGSDLPPPPPMPTAEEA